MNAGLAVSRCFAENLVLARKQVGLSQEEVGWRASLHRTEIGLLERGERCPRIDTVVKLASAIDASVEDLIEGIVWNPGSVQRGGFGLPGSSGPGA
jgi:DNA-binding XRE family transcriptional regulator